MSGSEAEETSCTSGGSGSTSLGITPAPSSSSTIAGGSPLSSTSQVGPLHPHHHHHHQAMELLQDGGSSQISSHSHSGTGGLTSVSALHHTHHPVSLHHLHHSTPGHHQSAAAAAAAAAAYHLHHQQSQSSHHNQSSLKVSSNNSSSSSSSTVGGCKVKRTRQRVDAGEPRNSYASITNFSSTRASFANHNNNSNSNSSSGHHHNSNNTSSVVSLASSSANPNALGYHHGFNGLLNSVTNSNSVGAKFGHLGHHLSPVSKSTASGDSNNNNSSNPFKSSSNFPVSLASQLASSLAAATATNATGSGTSSSSSILNSVTTDREMILFEESVLQLCGAAAAAATGGQISGFLNGSSDNNQTTELDFSKQSNQQESLGKETMSNNKETKERIGRSNASGQSPSGSPKSESGPAHLLRDILQTGRKTSATRGDGTSIGSPSAATTSNGKNEPRTCLEGGTEDAESGTKASQAGDVLSSSRTGSGSEAEMNGSDEDEEEDLMTEEDGLSKDGTELMQDEDPVGCKTESVNDEKESGLLLTEEATKSPSGSRSTSPLTGQQTTKKESSQESSSLATGLLQQQQQQQQTPSAITQVKRARVENIVSNMLHSGSTNNNNNGSNNNGSPTEASTKSADHQRQQQQQSTMPVNGCKKRKLYQPQQSKLNSEEDEEDMLMDEEDEELIRSEMTSDDLLLEDEIQDEEDLFNEIADLSAKRAKLEEKSEDKENLKGQLEEMQAQLFAMKNRYVQLFAHQRLSKDISNTNPGHQVAPNNSSNNSRLLQSPVNLTTTSEGSPLLGEDGEDLDDNLSDKEGGASETPVSQLSESTTVRDESAQVNSGPLSSLTSNSITDPAQFLNEARRILSEQEKLVLGSSKQRSPFQQQQLQQSQQLQPPQQALPLTSASALNDVESLCDALKQEIQTNIVPSLLQVIDLTFARFLREKRDIGPLGIKFGQELVNESPVNASCSTHNNSSSNKDLTILSQMLESKSPKSGHHRHHTRSHRHQADHSDDQPQQQQRGPHHHSHHSHHTPSGHLPLSSKSLNGLGHRGSPFGLPPSALLNSQSTPQHQPHKSQQPGSGPSPFAFPPPGFKSPFFLPNMGHPPSNGPQPGLIPPNLAQHFSSIASVLSQQREQQQQQQQQQQQFKDQQTQNGNREGHLQQKRDSTSSTTATPTNGVRESLNRSNGNEQNQTSAGQQPERPSRSANSTPGPEQTEAISLVVPAKRSEPGLLAGLISANAAGLGGRDGSSPPASFPHSGPPSAPPPLVPVSLPTSVAIPNPSLHQPVEPLFGPGGFTFADPTGRFGFYPGGGHLAHHVPSLPGDLSGEDGDVLEKESKHSSSAAAQAAAVVSSALAAHHLSMLAAANRGSPDSLHGYPGGLVRTGMGSDNGADGSELSFNDSSQFDGNMPLTSTLTPMHLRKAKLMFFYVRYPSSAILKMYFPDIKFNKNNTAQLVKWFSNFREFYYIQMEKYARQAVSEGLKNAEDIRVTNDSELLRVLNLHYNRNNHIEVPEHFRYVVEQTLREFFKSVVTGKDSEQSWKKAIYKVIARLDDNVPEYFKSPNFLEQLE